MSSQENGIPGNITSHLPAPLVIVSSTNTAPIQVTLSGPHGRTTGDVVTVYSHQVNVSANGQWPATVISPTVLSLDGTTGVGVGGVTGRVQPLTSPTFAVPSDGDPRNAASVDVALEALADRSAAALTMIGEYKLREDNSFAHDDAFSGATNWTATVSATTTPTAFSGTGLPRLATLDSLSTDLLEIQLDTSVSVGANATWSFALYYATQDPGGSLSAYARIPGSTKTVAPYNQQAGSAGGTVELSLRGFVSPAKPIVELLLYVYQNGGSSPQTVITFGDYLWTIKQWRLTGMVQ